MLTLVAQLPFGIDMTLMTAAAILLSALLLKLMMKSLPRDMGREYAVNGALSAGKARGAGIVFICSFIIVSMIFVPLSIEYGVYYALIFIEMMSGYLDDKSDKPWGEYKKGMIDFIVSALTATVFVIYNRGLLDISVFGHGVSVHPIVYGVIATFVFWLLINAVNCADGIDGFSTTLTAISLVSALAAGYLLSMDSDTFSLAFIMLAVLVPYLWKNSPPSTVLMGDAGSRSLGLFLCLIVLKTGNALLIIPLCFMLCLDGLIGIFKVSVIRFLKFNPLKRVRTPLHDHFRKNKGWSDSQVRYRFSIIQLVISAVTLLLLNR